MRMLRRMIQRKGRMQVCSKFKRRMMRKRQKVDMPISISQEEHLCNSCRKAEM